MQNQHKQLIISLLNDADLDIKLNLDKLDPIAGGVVSLILSTSNLDSSHQDQQIVIKHTLENIIMENGPFGGRDQDTLLTIAPKTHQLDFQILSLLQNSQKVTVPKVLWGDPSKRTTIMRDFRADGYILLQDLLVTDKLKAESAKQIGKILANLVIEFKRISSKVTQIENPVLQAEERLDELLTFLRPEIQLFREIQHKFLSGNHLIPTDGHPKNTAINQKGDAMVFDFGRSIMADPQYVAPNFAAHIGLAVIGGCFSEIDEGMMYLKNFIQAYDNHAETGYKIDELWFVRYFTAELLHRGLSGRWIDARIFANSSLQEVERAIHDICIEVFRPEEGEKIEKIKNLFNLLAEIANNIKLGKYRGKR